MVATWESYKDGNEVILGFWKNLNKSENALQYSVKNTIVFWAILMSPFLYDVLSNKEKKLFANLDIFGKIY